MFRRGGNENGRQNSRRMDALKKIEYWEPEFDMLSYINLFLF